MKKTRVELDAELAKFERHVIQMVDECPECDLMDAIAGEAEVIEDAAAPAELAHVHSRIQCILRDAGLIPGDEEPCSG